MAYAIEAEQSEAPGNLTNFLAIGGLAAFAISLPLVRMLIDAPEFFIAHDVSQRGALLFFLTVTLVVPALLGAVSALRGATGRIAANAIFAVLALGAVASTLQPISSASTFFHLAVVGGTIGLIVADRRTPAIRAWLAWVAPLTLLLAAWAVGPSRIGSYIRSGEATALEIEDTQDIVTPPIVFITFDEFPLSALLTSDLEVNRERFPNFAALGDVSDWYRNASSVSPQTSESVPALLSGKAPESGRVPIAAQYPDNLFLQLGLTYEVHAYEPITALCPDTVCGKAAEAPDPVGGGEVDSSAAPGGGADTGSLLSDVFVVYRHAVGSDSIRAGLPPITQGWAGFGGAGPANIERASAGDDGPSPERGGYGTFTAEARTLHELLAAPSASDRPQLRFAHIIAPHMPWLALPDGSTYDNFEPPGLDVSGGSLTWGSEEHDRMLGYQRHLLQVGALDRELGAVRLALEADGTWDEALVVVTADHGIQFEPGAQRSIDDGGREVTAVPLFIKRPGQAEGAVLDAAALTIDIVPTILGELGVRSPSSFDGLDLARDDIPSQRAGAFDAGGTQTTPDQTTDGLQELVDARSRWIDPDGTWAAVHQPGVGDPMVGSPMSAFGPIEDSSASWRRAEGEAGGLVTVDIDGVVDATTLLYACGEIVSAALAPPEPAATHRLFVDPTHCPDPDTGRLLVLDGGGRAHLLRSTP